METIIKSVKNPLPTLEQFEHLMETQGESMAPNGCCYYLTTYTGVVQSIKGQPCVIRTRPDQTVDTIVGYNSFPFETRNMALYWAIQDGRREFTDGRGLHERRLLA